LRECRAADWWLAGVAEITLGHRSAGRQVMDAWLGRCSVGDLPAKPACALHESPSRRVGVDSALAAR
jgi:hypothetical protein